MRRFHVGDRVKFKQGSSSIEEEGDIVDVVTVDFNDVYSIDVGDKEPLTVMDIVPNTIKLVGKYD